MILAHLCFVCGTEHLGMPSSEEEVAACASRSWQSPTGTRPSGRWRWLLLWRPFSERVDLEQGRGQLGLVVGIKPQAGR